MIGQRLAVAIGDRSAFFGLGGGLSRLQKKNPLFVW